MSDAPPSSRAAMSGKPARPPDTTAPRPDATHEASRPPATTHDATAPRPDATHEASRPPAAPRNATTAHTDATPAARSSAWLVSRGFDLAVFVLPALASLLLASLGSKLAGAHGRTPTWAWLVFVVGIDVAHVHATTLRVYLTPRELARRPALYLGVPVLALLVSAGTYAHDPLLFWRLLAYLAVFHFVRQQIGWARLYRKRAGETSRLDARLDEAALYAAMLYPLLVWHLRLPVDFEWFVPGDFVTWRELLPSLGARGAQQLTAAAGAIWAGILASFGLRQLYLRARGVPLRSGKLWLVATTASTWFCGIVLFADDFAFTVTNVVAHGVPYMAMSQRVTRAAPVAPLAWAPLARSGLVYVCALAALAFAEEWLWDASVWHEHASLFPAWTITDLELLAVPLLSLPQIVHYVLDAYLWRLDGTNPGLKSTLLAGESATGIRSAYEVR